MDIQKEIKISEETPVVFLPDTEMRELYRAMVKRCKRHLRAFEDYLEAVQEDMFKQAFQYGYKQGLKAANIELLLQ